MDWQAIVAGIGAILTGAGGCVIVIREFRRRDRQALKSEIDEMSIDISRLRTDLIAARRYGFQVVDMLTQRGIDPPDPPALHHGPDLKP